MTYHLIQHPHAMRQFDSLNAARHAGDTDGKYSLIFETETGERVSLIWAKVGGKFLTVPEHVGEGDMVTALGQAIDWMTTANQTNHTLIS
jgi:NADH:ubiquinone oxidoreductase subunit D